MTRDPEEAGDSLLEELMTVFADPYVDKLTYIAAMEIAGLGEKVASLEDALASITRERDEAINTASEWAIKCGVAQGLVTKAEAERDEAREALKPFAEEAKNWATTDRAFVPMIADTGVWASTPAKYTVGDLHRAAALVNGEV